MVSASHYRDLLHKETEAISNLCEKWQLILKDDELTSAIPDEASGKIQIAIGQAQLLLKKKFEQFRGLIDLCGNEDATMRVTVQDLQGFWELMYIQVEDIYSKFNEVHKLQENDWQPGSMTDVEQRQPLGNLNKSINNHRPNKPLLVNKDLRAQAKERLAQAKALARMRIDGKVQSGEL